MGIVNLNNNAGSGAAVTVADTGSNNTLLVTPTALHSATSQISGQIPVVNTTSAGSLAVTLASGGSDQLVVNGSQYDDTITVTGSTVQVTNATQGTLQQVGYLGRGLADGQRQRRQRHVQRDARGDPDPG